MRVNEQPLSSFKQTPRENRSGPENFERWMFNPTQKNSGDAYYWLHQDKLQKSALHFDKSSLQQVNDSSSYCAQHMRKIQLDLLISKVTDIQMVFPDLTTKLPDIDSIKINHSQALEQPYRRLMKMIMPQQYPHQETSKTAPLKTDSSISSQTNQTNGTTTTRNQLKNHHLFVQDNKVELTLNTHEISSREHKKLKQLIQSFLKLKNLALGKLTINGVKK